MNRHFWGRRPMMRESDTATCSTPLRHLRGSEDVPLSLSVLWSLLRRTLRDLRNVTGGRRSLQCFGGGLLVGGGCCCGAAFAWRQADSSEVLPFGSVAVAVTKWSVGTVLVTVWLHDALPVPSVVA